MDSDSDADVPAAAVSTVPKPPSMADELAKIDEAALCLKTGFKEYSRYAVTTGEISREEISRCQTLAAQMSNLLEVFDNIIELANKRVITITAEDGRHLVKLLSERVVPVGLALKPQALRMQNLKNGKSTYKLIRTVNHSAQVLVRRYAAVRRGKGVDTTEHEFADELPKLRKLASATGASSEDEA
jgi:hypothetical protein